MRTSDHVLGRALRLFAQAVVLAFLVAMILAAAAVYADPLRCFRETIEELPVIHLEVVYGGPAVLPPGIPSAPVLDEMARQYHDALSVPIRMEIEAPVGGVHALGLPPLNIPGSNLQLGWSGNVSAESLVIWYCVAGGEVVEEARVLAGRLVLRGMAGELYTERLVSTGAGSLPYPLAFEGLSDLDWTTWEVERFDGGIGTIWPYEALYVSLRLSTRRGYIFADGFESGNTDRWSGAVP